MGYTKYKVLLIEDDVLDCMAFQRFINDQKLLYDYTEARSISEAKEILMSEQFDIIVSDYSLGDGTALDILNSVKDTPIILTTGAADEQVAINAWRAGAYDYLPKDIDLNYLKAVPKAIENAIKRKKMEDALDRKQEDLEAIFEAAPVGMLLTDENMIVGRVNYTIKEMLHREYARIIDQPIGLALGCINSTESEEGCGFGPACEECLLKKAMSSVLDSGKSVQEIEIHPTLQIDNQQIKPWFCISVKPVMVGGRRHLIVAINDITHRKRAEEELKETMELKSQFISTISHELRTPLTGMIEGIAIVLDEVAGPINEKQTKFLGIAKRNADRLSDLIDDVLDFQRLGAGKMKLYIQSHDIKEVLLEVQETMTLYAGMNSIEISFVYSDDLSKAEFDRAKMIQVLTNLVSNAVKFTPEKGRVSVIVQRGDNDWVVSVSDTGMGIPKEELSKIFDPFYRVNRRGKQIRGTGLGLAIVNKIVKLHSGTIEVESEVDQGTTFTIFLPLNFKPSPGSPTETVDKLLENIVATPG
ncbi:MAG: PAS domain-containing sensor histidine kinase [Planctomycetota bacterium]|jgi:signal transduction histidine kinase/DNA-binding response OmpR family regulator